MSVTNASGAKVPLINDAAAIAMAREIAVEIGLKLEDSLDPSAGSDNFAEFLEAFPGFYMNLGTHSSRPGTSGNHHNPTFDVEESTFKKDVEFFLTYTQRFLA